MRFVCSGLVQASPVQFVFFIGGPRDQPAAPQLPGVRTLTGRAAIGWPGGGDRPVIGCHHTHQPVRGGDNFCVNSLGETAERGERTKKRMADW